MELIAVLFKKVINDSVEITMEKESRKELREIQLHFSKIISSVQMY